MKYEAVFGDQSLFFDAHRDCEMVGNGHHKVENGKLMVWNFSEKRWCNSHTNTIMISAMRRIIAEPKRWTMEDKKAGRLPDVDWVVRATGVNEDARIAAINNDSVCVVFEDGVFVTLHVSGIAPIEAPDEKAQREEDEFVKLMIDLASESQLMSCGFKDGVISAYRKLKGGE